MGFSDLWFELSFLELGPGNSIAWAENVRISISQSPNQYKEFLQLYENRAFACLILLISMTNIYLRVIIFNFCTSTANCKASFSDDCLPCSFFNVVSFLLLSLGASFLRIFSVKCVTVVPCGQYWNPKPRKNKKKSIKPQ